MEARWRAHPGAQGRRRGAGFLARAARRDARRARGGRGGAGAAGARPAIFDGEAIALRADGTPLPFQVDDVALRPQARCRRAASTTLPLSRSSSTASTSTACRSSTSRSSSRFDALCDQAAEPRRPRTAPADAASRRGVSSTQRYARRPRGRDGEEPRGALCGRPPRPLVAQGQGSAHARPRHPRRRVGQRPAQGLAQQPAPRRARSGTAAGS